MKKKVYSYSVFFKFQVQNHSQGEKIDVDCEKQPLLLQ